MTIKRLYHSIRLLLIRTDGGRAEYIKRKRLFAHVGDNCKWGGWRLPVYPNLIRLGDNVNVHKTAKILTHDLINRFLQDCCPEVDFGGAVTLGPVELCDNVHISKNAIILPNVRIGRNCIIGAGAVVSSDVPENSVVAGNPAEVVGRFDSYSALRQMFSSKNTVFSNQYLPEELARKKWEEFERLHVNNEA